MMAVIIPYRERKEHLAQFLPHLKNFLKELPHRILIIEQGDNQPFNRGKLLNIGFSLTKAECTYVCFHDVDMLPLKADYSYPEIPTHLAEAVEQFNFEMPYASYFGGVTLFNCTDFEKVNGFSNNYWGWGAEDDDLHRRCQHAGLEIGHRRGFFSSLAHIKVEENDPLVLANQDRLEEFLYGPSEIPDEGLNSLKYELINKQEEGNIIHYQVKL